jgi:hypothetical protein
LGGCAVVAPFDAAVLESARSGGKTIVMLRFRFTDQDGRALPPLEGSASGDGLGLMLGDFDSGGVPERRLPAVRFPTPAARTDGIVYAVLPPGYYYLVFQAARRTDAFAYQARFRAVPRWRLAVPAGVPVLYAGTFSLRGRSERMLLGDVLIVAIDQEVTVVEDESGWARAAAARDLPGLPPPVTRLAVRHAGPILLGTPPSIPPSD